MKNKMAASIIRNMKLMNLIWHKNVKYLTTTKVTVVQSYRSPNWTPQTRSIHFKNPFSKRYDYRPLDSIPSGYECIYKNTMNNYIVYSYPFCAFGVVSSFGALVLTLAKSYDVKLYIEFMNAFIFDNVYELLLVIPAMCLISYVFKLIVDRCVLRIYYNEAEQNFIAIFGSIVPWRVRKMTFDCGQVKSLYPYGSETTTLRIFQGEYAVGRRKLILFPTYFKLPYYLNIMMGYET